MPRDSLQSRVVRLDNAVHHGGLRPVPISMVILHATEGDSAKSSIDYLNTTTDKIASYHYIIDRDGTIVRMTAPNLVAYHAGDSAWPNPIRATPAHPDRPNDGRSLNRCSVGIAWANRGDGEPLTQAQIDSALWLCATFVDGVRVPVAMVRGHYEISPGRKSDPSPAMSMDDWRTRLTTYLGAP